MKTKLILLLLFVVFLANAQAVPNTKFIALSTLEQLLSFAPIVFYIGTTGIIFLKLKKEDYKIGDALKENEIITVSVPNPSEETARSESAPFVDQKTQPKSSSRLLAFLSGMLTLGLSSVFCSFWIYRYFQTGLSTNLDDIVEVLLTLGLGVVPYAFNKISAAIK